MIDDDGDERGQGWSSARRRKQSHTHFSDLTLPRYGASEFIVIIYCVIIYIFLY